MNFVDSSAWFAAVNVRDRHHRRATEILDSGVQLVTSELVLVETWLLTNRRIDFSAAQRFWHGVRDSDCEVLRTTDEDWEQAWSIAARFPDQTFSIVDRTSFALMQRLGIRRAVAFDDDFVIYRYGPNRTDAFEVMR